MEPAQRPAGPRLIQLEPMRLKGTLITIVVILGAAFAAVNWQALFAVQSVNLFFTTVEIPLGLVLLFVGIALSLVFFLVSIFDRAVQLRQITQQENAIFALQSRLDKRRLEELSELGESVRSSLDGAVQQLREENARLEVSMREDVSSFETRMRDRIDELEDQLRSRPAIDPMPPAGGDPDRT